MTYRFSTCCLHTQYIFSPNTAGMRYTCVVMPCTLLRGGGELSEFALAQELVAVPTSQFGGVVHMCSALLCRYFPCLAHTVGISLRVVRLHPSNQVQAKNTPFSMILPCIPTTFRLSDCHIDVSRQLQVHQFGDLHTCSLDNCLRDPVSLGSFSLLFFHRSEV